MGRQGMDTLTGELQDIREEFILAVPEMLLGLHNSTDSIKGKPGHPLTLHGVGPIVDEGLEGLSIFALDHLKLLPVCMLVISFISIDVKDFGVVKSPGVEDLPVLQLMGELKFNLRVFPARDWVKGHVAS